jgi:hypothetical protein
MAVRKAQATGSLVHCILWIRNRSLELKEQSSKYLTFLARQLHRVLREAAFSRLRLNPLLHSVKEPKLVNNYESPRNSPR